MYNEKFIQKIDSFILTNLEKTKTNFIIQDEELLPEHIAGSDKLSGLFIVKAMEHYTEIFGKEPDVSFYENEHSFLDYSPIVGKDMEIMALWAHLLHYTIEELIKNNLILKVQKKPIPLDELYDIWLAKDKKIIKNPYLFEPIQSNQQ